MCNIVHDGRISLMFMVAGCNTVVRLNGQAVLTDDPGLRERFAKADKQPATVIYITVGEVYFQCAKALMRSQLWAGGDQPPDVPRAGAFLAERDAAFDGAAYDAAYPARAQQQLW